MLAAMFGTTNHVKGLAGLVLSSSLTAASVTMGNMVHPIVGTLPVWGQTILEWSPLIGAPIGLTGMFFYAVNMMLASRSGARKEREEHRNELREIQEAAGKVAATVAAEAVKTAREVTAVETETARHVADAAAYIAECVRRQAAGECPMQEVFVKHQVRVTASTQKPQQKFPDIIASQPKIQK